MLKFYRQLNSAQKQAVDTIEGPVMVRAGPGTGKTQVLTLRIANILRLTDTPPDAILALTFTNSGVQAMRQRLVEIIGSAGFRVNIHTFHSFCNEIIRRYPEKFPRIIGANNALPVDQIKILTEIISQSRLKLLKPFGNPDYYLLPIISEIERLKKENLEPKQLNRIIKIQNGDQQKQKELALIYQRYETILAARRLYDFADMIMEVIRVLERDKDFLLTLQEEYQYLLADEHQDANQGQNRLLELLASFHSAPNLFIVGDEKQAIFQFQGASLDNFDYFKKLYPQIKQIELTDNYRSPQTILDSAYRLISHGPRLLARAVRPAENQKIILRVFPTPEAEIWFLAKEIKEKIAAGAAPETIAVLYRDNDDAKPIIEHFEKIGLPFVLRSNSDILDDLEIQKFLLLLRAVNNFGDDRILVSLLHLDFLKMEVLSVYELQELARRKKVRLYHLFRTSKNKSFANLYRQLARWRQLAANQSCLDFFSQLARESGFLAYLLNRLDGNEKIAKLEVLYREVQSLSQTNRQFQLADFIKHLNFLTEHHLPIKMSAAIITKGVELLTVHRAKGLEFEHVYLVNVYDGHWGNRRSNQPFSIPTRPGLSAVGEKNDDERRLFYVALTRAKRSVSISYARENNEGRLFLPSQFIQELNLKPVESENLVDHKVIFAPKIQAGSLPFDYHYLGARFRAQGLSPTALNNYLKCPINYLFGNLLDVIKIHHRHLLYGLAIHRALEDFFNHFRRGEKVSQKMLWQSFQHFARQQPFSESDLAAALARGRMALAGYYRTRHHQWSRQIINEYFVRGVQLFPHLVIKGKIDKIVLLGDNQATVVDYKTGAPKSRRELLGETKNATADYFRQLVFYKLLLQEKFQVACGVIDFIEPNARGRWKSEEFELTSDHLTELKNILRRVAGEIESGRFLTLGCGRFDCPGCRLWSMMKR